MSQIRHLKNLPVWFWLVLWMSLACFLLVSLIWFTLILWFDYYIRRVEFLQLGQGAHSIKTLADNTSIDDSHFKTLITISQVRNIYLKISNAKTGTVIAQSNNFNEMKKVQSEPMWKSKAHTYSLYKTKNLLGLLKAIGETIWKDPTYSLSDAYHEIEIYFAFKSWTKQEALGSSSDISTFEVLRSPPFWLVYFALEIETASGPPLLLEMFYDKSTMGQLLIEYTHGLYLTTTLFFICLVIIGFIITKKSLKPLNTIASAMSSIYPSDLSKRIELQTVPMDLKLIVHSFNGVLERLESAFLKLSQFSADIAHEFRTPLNNLRGTTEVALRQPRSVEEYQDLLGSNLEECQRLSKMVEDLLFLARTENPDMEIEKKTFLIQKELQLMVDIFEGLAQEKNIILNIQADETLYILGDKILFHRMIVNIVSNAIRYTPPGGCITLGAQMQEHSLLVYVKDTGTGMSPEVAAKAFDRLYRADQARTGTKQHNLGLGLAMVKNMIHLHKGKAHLQSVEGQGTTVFLEFPIPHPFKPSMS